MKFSKIINSLKFFKRSYETARADGALKILMDKGKKLNEIYARSSPIMEVLTGIMIAILIFYSGNLIISDELGIGNFFIFSCNDVSISACKVACYLEYNNKPRISWCKRILPIIDLKEKFPKTIV